jgi:multidrug efflux pump subunit AcrB
MNLSELALRFRPAVAMLAVVLMGYGAVSYLQLPAREDPKITVREAVVTTDFEGLAASRVEQLITKTIEEAVRRVAEIEEIRSVSMPGRSIVHAEVDDSFFDLEPIWDDLRQEVERAAADLPDGASPPVVNDDFGDVATVTAALTAPDFTMAELVDMAEHVRDRLYTVAGTKRVELVGAQPERIFIETRNARLAELGVDPDRLVATLAEQNVIRPGGEVDTGARSFVIEPTGNFESVEAIRDALVRLPSSGALVAVRDVAEVRRGLVDPPVRPAYVNGERAIVLAISMLDGRSVLDHAARVRAELDAIEATLPVGYALDIVTYQAEQVANAVYGVSLNVAQTLAIVLAVVVLFLGVRIGLIVGAIVPTVMLITVAVMGVFEMTLQRMSLATLVIALGLLVDNGIVVAEDFKRRLAEGADRDQVLRRTGGELALPLLASTLTTILVFLPLMLADHASGEYTRAISLVIVISLLTSWGVAMTITPVLCWRFLRAPPPAGAPARGAERLFAGLAPLYASALRRTLRRRWLFLAAMVALLSAALAGLAAAPKKFFPDSDRTQVLVYVDLPPGVTTRTTDRRMRAIFEAVKDDARFPHVETFAGYVGFGGPRFVLSLTPIDPAPNKGFIVLNVDRGEHMEPTMAALRQLFRRDFPDLEARVTRMFLGPSDSSTIEVQVKGPDAEVLDATARDIERRLADVPGAIDLYHDWEGRLTRLRVEVDQARAQRAGVASADIARALETYFSGRTVSEFREGDDIFPIVARAAEAERVDVDRVKTIAVYVRGSDRQVPLLQVADVELVNDWSRIARENMSRTITVEARNRLMTAEDMVPVIADDLARIEADLPPGHAIEFDGVVAQSAEGRAALAANIPLCLGAMLVLLVAQFNGYARPLIIFATIPLVLIGAVLGLLVLGADFGFMPILGIYALAGIIINNAIVLVDRIDIERRNGAKPDLDALIDACARRLRPILMTTITTILGLLPLIIFADALFYGMASVMAGGLLVGTILTLGVVPVLYSLAFNIRADRGRPATARGVSPAGDGRVAAPGRA